MNDKIKKYTNYIKSKINDEKSRKTLIISVSIISLVVLIVIGATYYRNYKFNQVALAKENIKKEQTKIKLEQQKLENEQKDLDAKKLEKEKKDLIQKNAQLREEAKKDSNKAVTYSGEQKVGITNVDDIKKTELEAERAKKDGRKINIGDDSEYNIKTYAWNMGEMCDYIKGFCMEVGQFQENDSSINNYPDLINSLDDIIYDITSCNKRLIQPTFKIPSSQIGTFTDFANCYDQAIKLVEDMSDDKYLNENKFDRLLNMQSTLYEYRTKIYSYAESKGISDLAG